ncbi:MAG: phosphodiester glycosidase family protein, partial [Gaiellaceae bacterium]
GVQFTPHGPVALHIVRGPRPVGLYRLRPVLSNESVLNRETVSSMQRRLSTQATSVGVNGDFFSPSDGHPSGIMLRDGILVTPPNSSRSSAGVMLDGTLDVRRIGFRGTWRGLGQRRSLNFFNKAPGKNGISLFSSDWGTATPRVEGSYAVVLSQFPAATPNTDITAVVTSAAQNAAVGIVPGAAVLVARGSAAARLQAEAPAGTTIALRLILQPDWTAVSDAIGGGPLLVREGAPVYRANEAFTTSQLAPRGPRSAVAQRADGSVLFVATDGRQPGYSVGMTNFELAQTLVRLGAVRGMALDGGGSSTLAFEGAVLNRPSEGRERLVSNALMLQYFGVYSPPPAEAVVSPNGDGAAETQTLSFKVVRPSNVTVNLTAPDGTIAFHETIARLPGSYPVAFPPPLAEPPPPLPGEPMPPTPVPLSPAEGRWVLSVTSTDDQGLLSSAVRRFAVNSTLGFLRVEPTLLVLRRGGGSATVRWTQTRSARVKVTVETIDGVLIRV